jgi:hypothetical protein
MFVFTKENKKFPVMGGLILGVLFPYVGCGLVTWATHASITMTLPGKIVIQHYSTARTYADVNMNLSGLSITPSVLKYKMF